MIHILKDDEVVNGTTYNGQRLDVLATTSNWTGFQVPSKTIVVRRARLVRIVSLAVPYKIPTNVIPPFAIGIYPTKMVG